MIYTGSKALQYLSIPVFTIFKNLTIILIAFLERFYLNGPNVTSLILLSFMMMVLSSLVAGFSDVTEHEFNIGGYFWMLVNCLSTAVFTLMMKATIKKVNFKDYDTVYFNSKNT
jgi:GDP-mannose transporter